MSDPHWSEIFDYIEEQNPVNCIVPPLSAFRRYNFKSYFDYHLYDEFDLFILHKGMATWFNCEFLKHIFSSYSILLENPVFIIIGTKKYKKKKINIIHIKSFVNKINKRHKEKLENKKIIFLHIPKCSGTSFANLLKHKYKKNIYFSNNSELINYKQDLNNYNVIAGHINLNIIKNKIESNDVIWLTILRHPIDRFLSVVAHSRRESIENLGPTMTALRKMKLNEFLTSNLAFNELHMIYRILTIKNYKKINEYNLSELSDQILNFLEKDNVYFGFQERFDEYINNLFKITDIKLSLNYMINKKANITGNYHCIAKEEIDEVRDILSKEMETDIIFYNRAVELYNHKYKQFIK